MQKKQVRDTRANCTKRAFARLYAISKYSTSKAPRSKAAEARQAGDSPKKHLRINPVPPAAYSGRMYPNGEFGIGKIPLKKKKIEDKRFDKGQVQGYQMGDVPKCHELSDGTKLYHSGDLENRALFKLGSPPELSHSSKRYGLKGISAYGRRAVRNIGLLMERKYGKRCLQMGTITIPSLPHFAMRRIASSWSYLVRRFFEEISRIYKRSSYRFQYVSVTEIQPKRWEKRKEVGLHLHFLYPAFKNKNNGEWVLHDNIVRELWKRLLTNLLHECTQEGIDLESLPTPNYRREVVRKNAAAYLAKYMSKGSDMCAEIIAEMGEEFIPSQWWNTDSVSRAELKASIKKLSADACEMLVQMCKSGIADIFYYISAVEIDTLSNGKRIIGYCGRLKDEPMKILLSI